MPRGRRTIAAHTAIERESSPPSGKPTSTFTRDYFRSFGFHFSSMAPDEKKNTSYGVMAAPKRAIAKYQYVIGDSEECGDGCRRSCDPSASQSGCRRNT